MLTLKAREDHSITKHIHTFKSLLEQLVTIGALISNNETIFPLMKNTPFSFQNILSSMTKQSNLTLQCLITYLVLLFL